MSTPTLEEAASAEATPTEARPAERRPLFTWVSRLRPLWAVLYVTLLPVCLVHDLLVDLWRSGTPRAWDGTGHYGVAQIYATSIFPDTFGWTQAHFGGMPFPNFYPPLFFWLLGLLNSVGIFSFLTSFKLLVLLPLMLIPAAVWLLAWSVSEGDRRVAFWSALASVLPLLSARFGGQVRWASGLDYFSTISIGMYTQPLGFVLLLAWYAVYVRAQRSLGRFALACALLALAVLANFLNVITSTLVVAATLLFDVLRHRRALVGDDIGRDAARRALVAHALSPFVSAALALFWLVPMLDSYDYFVTRPFTMVIVTTDMLVWFAIAAAGVVWWWRRRRTEVTAPFVVNCLMLAGILTFAASAAPHWLPLQANRFTPTLYFLCAVPLGYAITGLIDLSRAWLLRRFPRFEPFVRRAAPYAFGLLLVALALNYLYVSRLPLTRFYYEYQARLAFYPPPGAAPPTAAAQAARPISDSRLPQKRPSEVRASDLLEAISREHTNDAALTAAAAASVEDVLGFARGHRDGRYLVEIPAQYRVDAASFDGRALNSYLGAQGNQTLTVVYREASPNSIFMFPQVGALSYNPDNFGFSSVLGDDLDFVEQPLAKHLERIRLLGGRYLVINSDKIKERLAQEPAIGARSDFGAWSVFELRELPPPPVRVLPYRPALVVSPFTVKGRRNAEENFIRLAEEQFSDGWFDVLLARAPTSNLDELGDLTELNQFGALILDTYECTRCELVYSQLKSFAQTRPLILLMRDASLFNRIRYSIEEFPMATVIERDAEAGGGEWLDNLSATRRYGASPLRAQWAKMRGVLEAHKIPVAGEVSGEVGPGSVRIDYRPESPPELGLPVLVSMSYHPDWRAVGRQPVYAANPMFMLTFVRQPTRLVFARSGLDRLGALTSAGTLVALLGVCLWHYRSRLRRRAA